jgi:hydrogenase/urease accessory protein HupE
MKVLAALLAVGLLLVAPTFAKAHEVRPGFLELTSQDGRHYDVLWKTPMRGEAVLSIRPVFPPTCSDQVPVTQQRVPGALLERRSLDCGDEGLIGKTVAIDGLSTTMTDVLVRVADNEGQAQSLILKPDNASFTISGTQPWTQVAADYVRFGVEHILLGIDHLLFVLGLLLIVRGTARLVKTITAFTVAHSITLAAATLGWAHVPQAPVEAVIALSILFLASELAKRREGHMGLTERYPWVVAFTFGLLHGFGFAGALSEVGLPQSDIPLALLTFNVGVEIGQLMFVGAVLALGWTIRRLLGAVPRWAPQAAAYGIGTVSAFWVIERVAGFW